MQNCNNCNFHMTQSSQNFAVKESLRILQETIIARNSLWKLQGIVQCATCSHHVVILWQSLVPLAFEKSLQIRRWLLVKQGSAEDFSDDSGVEATKTWIMEKPNDI